MIEAAGEASAPAPSIEAMGFRTAQEWRTERLEVLDAITFAVACAGFRPHLRAIAASIARTLGPLTTSETKDPTR